MTQVKNKKILNQDDFSYFLEIQYCWDAIYTVRLTERGDFPVPWTRRCTCKMGGYKVSMPSSCYWDRSDGEYRVKKEQTLSVPLGQIRW